MSAMRTNTGEALNEEWGVNARHSLYHKDGTFYMPLERFPGAYFDYHGYVIFQTREDYEKCAFLDIGQRVNAHRGISNIPGYIRKR